MISYVSFSDLLSTITARSIYVATNSNISLFLWLSNISLYTHTHTHTHTHIHTYMCHIFCIHSSGDQHLHCFHILTTVNRASMNTEMHVSFWITVLSRCMPGSGIAGSRGGSVPSFSGACILLSIVGTRSLECRLLRLLFSQLFSRSFDHLPFSLFVLYLPYFRVHPFWLLIHHRSLCFCSPALAVSGNYSLELLFVWSRFHGLLFFPWHKVLSCLFF